MVTITFVQPDGTSQTIKARPGDSVMQAAVSNNIDGIIAECGGSLSCSTCHCYIDAGWHEQTGAASETERDMLDFTEVEATNLSRLACQIELSAMLDGLVVYIPG